MICKILPKQEIFCSSSEMAVRSSAPHYHLFHLLFHVALYDKRSKQLSKQYTITACICCGWCKRSRRLVAKNISLCKNRINAREKCEQVRRCYKIAMLHSWNNSLLQSLIIPFIFRLSRRQCINHFHSKKLNTRSLIFISHSSQCHSSLRTLYIIGFPFFMFFLIRAMLGCLFYENRS